MRLDPLIIGFAAVGVQAYLNSSSVDIDGRHQDPIQWLTSSPLAELAKNVVLTYSTIGENPANLLVDQSSVLRSARGFSSGSGVRNQGAGSTRLPIQQHRGSALHEARSKIAVENINAMEAELSRIPHLISGHIQELRKLIHELSEHISVSYVEAPEVRKLKGFPSNAWYGGNEFTTPNPVVQAQPLPGGSAVGPSTTTITQAPPKEAQSSDIDGFPDSDFLTASTLEEGGQNETKTGDGRSFDGFPDPDALSASTLLHDHKNDAKTLAEIEEEKYHIKRRTENMEQANCAGAISMALLTAGAVALQIRSSVIYCKNNALYAGASYCARSVVEAIADTSEVARAGTNAGQYCGKENLPCSRSVEMMISCLMLVASSILRMYINCGPEDYGEGGSTGQAVGSVNFYWCGSDLQRLSTNMAMFIGEITNAKQVCHAPWQAKKPKKDIGVCIGSALASCGYLAAIALEWMFIPSSCNQHNEEFTDDDVYTLYDGSDIQCALTITTGVNSLGASTVMITETADACGGLDTACAQQITKMVTSISEAANAWTNVALYCPWGTEGEYLWNHEEDVEKWMEWCGLGGPDTSIEDVVATARKYCAMSISYAIKSLSMMASAAQTTSDACKGLNLASTNCGTAITNALASWSMISSQVSAMTVNCDPHSLEIQGVFSPPYFCGINMQVIGYTVDTLSTSIGTAIADCGLPPGHAALNRPQKLPRRFYVPR